MMGINIFESKFILIYVCVLLFILGSVFGSFLCCMADRYCLGEKWYVGKSHCDACGHELNILDLFPIFSYIFLKGKCRYCGTKLSLRYVICEMILALLFVIYVLIFPNINLELLQYLGMICVLYEISLCDLKKYEIPDGCILFGIVWWLVFELLLKASLKDIGISVAVAFCISGSLLLISLLMDKLLQKETLGGGDIKLEFLCCLYLPVLNNLFALVVACLLGLLFILISKKEMIPFGPSIALGWYLTVLFGSEIISWYMSLLTL